MGHLFQQLFKEGRQLSSKNGMVFHIWMPRTTMGLHRFEKKCRDGLVRRIQAIDMVFYCRKIVLKMCSLIASDHWTA